MLTACTSDDGSSEESSFVSSADNEVINAIYENSTPSTSEKISGTESLSYIKSEKITYTEGTSSLDGIEFKYDSQFFGHDSAINRDYGYYGFQFIEFFIQNFPVLNGFSAEFTGDYYEDLVDYKRGKLRIFPNNIETDRTYTYNETVYDVIRGNEESLYYFGDPITFSLEIDAILRGVGDFDGNKYVDFLFVSSDKKVIIGLAYEDGIQLTEDGKYRLTYLATTANDPESNAAIFFSEAGMGVLEFTLQ